MGKLTVDECKRIIMQGKKQLTAAEQRIAELEGELALREEIVRCRDCDYYDHWEASGRYREKHACGHWDYLEIKPDGFCAWGERKERIEQ